MVQVPEILRPARVPPLSLVCFLSRLAVWRLFPRAEKLKSASFLGLECGADINTDTLAPLSRRWILFSRSSSVRIF
jgi:hypothetical protein